MLAIISKQLSVSEMADESSFVIVDKIIAELLKLHYVTWEN